jgi:hypothetical protein
MRTFDWERICLIVLACALSIVYAVRWGQMITDPAERSTVDFLPFYAVGRVAQDSGYSRAYDIALQHEVERELLGPWLRSDEVHLYIHPPFLIPLLKYLAMAGYVEAFVGWALLMLIIHLCVSLYWLKSLKPRDETTALPSLLVGLLLFFPFFISLLQGQDTSLLFLGVALWCVGILRNRDWLAATGLALTAVRPHICLVLAVPMLFRCRAVWWRFLLLSGALAVASMVMVGKTGTLQYLELLQLSGSGTWFGTNEAAMVNLLGLATRLFPSADAGLLRGFSWGIYLIGIALAVVLWIRVPRPDARLLGSTIVIALLCAPHLHYHDLALLAIPLVFAVRLLAPRIPDRRLALVLLAASLMMLPRVLFYIAPYVLFGVLVWIFARQVEAPGQPVPHGAGLHEDSGGP